MTVSSTLFEDEYTADGSATDYEYTWRHTNRDQVAVYINDAVQEYGVDYTVVTNLNTTGIGGTVTFTDPPADGDTILIKRVVDLLQLDDLSNNAALPPATVMRMADKLTMIAQQQQNAIDDFDPFAVDLISPKRLYVTHPGNYGGVLANGNDGDGWYIYYSGSGTAAIDFDDRYCLRLTAPPGGDYGRYYSACSQFRRSALPFVRMQAGVDRVEGYTSFWVYLLDISINPYDVNVASSEILNSVGFRFCPDLGDTEIMAITADATTQATPVSTGLTPTVDHLYDFDFDLRYDGARYSVGRWRAGGGLYR
jgi:hypothetical protein